MITGGALRMDSFRCDHGYTFEGQADLPCVAVMVRAAQADERGIECGL